MRKKPLSRYSGILIFQSPWNNQTNFKQWPEIEKLGQGKMMFMFGREGLKCFLLSRFK